MRKYTMPRESYVPASIRDQEPDVPEGTDLAIWRWTENHVPYAICFQGKADKPLWHYRFTSVERREKRIAETVESRKTTLAYKAEQAKARREYHHDFQVGDFLVASWGYDQTNIDYYQVVSVPSGKSVVLRSVGKKVVGESQTSEYVVPDPDTFCGKPFSRRVSSHGVKVDKVSRAYKWDGRSRYQTAFGYGH